MVIPALILMLAAAVSKGANLPPAPLGAILETYQPPVVTLAPQDTDTGYSEDHGCNHMDAHWHKSDDSCHRDGDDSILIILPVPEGPYV